MKPRLKLSILTFCSAIILLPVHEVGHLITATLQGLGVVSFSLLSLTPNVVISKPGTSLFFLSGPLLALLQVSVALIYYRHNRQVLPYVLALTATVLLGGIQDFLTVIFFLL